MNRTARAVAMLALATVVAVGCGSVPSATANTVGAPKTVNTTDAARCVQLRSAAAANPPLYSPATSWNQPAACHPTRPDSARWADTWFRWANLAGRTDPAARGAIAVAFDEYSTPVYDLADATGTIDVYTSNYGWGQDLGNGRSLPWNPAWQPSAGNDQEMIIIDRATGREWDLWAVQTQNWTTCATLENLAAGYDPGVDLCAGNASLGRNPDGTVSDFRTSSGSSAGFGRGMGDVLGLALLPRLDEVERGSINHALNMETYATMFGPACTAAEANGPAAGVSCGYAVAPATRLEWFDGPAASCGAVALQPTDQERSHTVPEGMRFALNLTDAEIDRWLAGRTDLSPAARRTARIFAVALRDYGWIISDTTCWGSSVSVEGVANPEARTRWQQLGVTDPAADGPALLDGLITSAAQVRSLASPDPAKLLVRS